MFWKSYAGLLFLLLIELAKKALREVTQIEFVVEYVFEYSKYKLKEISCATSKATIEGKNNRSDLLTEHCADDELLSISHKTSRRC